jgi:peptide/nickel transport system permease protein
VIGEIANAIQKTPRGRAAIRVLGLLVVLAVLAGWLAGPAARAPSTAVLARPSFGHLLGTDAFGRDVLAMLIAGARTALLLGFGVTLVSLVFGCALGALAGMRGGMWDALVERLIEIVGVFPAVILVALVRSLERAPSAGSLVLVVALVRWTEMARLVRTLVLECLAHDWALAARATGIGPVRLAVVHVGPHLVRPVLLSATLSMGAVVLLESALSFLGLGTVPGLASWGELLGQVQKGAGPWVVLPPAIALAATVGSFHVIAEAVRGHFSST